MENKQKDDGFLTPVNVVAKCRQYVERLKAAVPRGEKCPINRGILMRLSFYMDYAVNWTNQVIASKVFDIVSGYFVYC